MTQENRRHPRFLVKLPMTFSGERVSGEGVVINLSKGGWGATIEGNQAVPEGMYLVLHLFLPDERPPLKVDSAAVRWSIEKEFGVELLYMGTEEADRLDRFINSLAPETMS